MNFPSQKSTFSIVAALCLLTLAGCNWPNVGENEPPDDFTQKSLEKHYQNGDMNDYQFQQSQKQLAQPDPNLQKPATDTTTSTTPNKGN